MCRGRADHASLLPPLPSPRPANAIMITHVTCWPSNLRPRRIMHPFGLLSLSFPIDCSWVCAYICLSPSFYLYTSLTFSLSSSLALLFVVCAPPWSESAGALIEWWIHRFEATLIAEIYDTMYDRPLGHAGQAVRPLSRAPFRPCDKG